MTELAVFKADNPRDALLRSRDFALIQRGLAKLGARIERWGAAHALRPGASQDEILAAYKPELDRLKAERGYRDADVAAIKPGDPQWPELRRKFLGEHTHDDDEARYFVEGSGAFYIHVGDSVHVVVGEAGDLLSVPKGVAHWFDGGLEADFTCIRVFSHDQGWVAHFTGDSISATFPAYEKTA